MKQNYVPVENGLIHDARLAPSAKRVYIAMKAYSNRKGILRKTVQELANIAHCSTGTVCAALKALQKLGMVRRVHVYREISGIPGKVYAANVYLLTRYNYGKDKGYTLVPRSLLAKPVSHATFVVALCLYAAAGKDGRAFPSIRAIAKAAQLAKSTVCLALIELRKCLEIIRLCCKRRNRTFACNSYLLTAQVHPVSLQAAPKLCAYHSKGAGIRQVFGVVRFLENSTLLPR